MTRALVLLALLAVPAQAGPDHQDLAGHYYLQGVMEVGSELLLRADGSYEWFISYGAVDQFSHGRWTVTALGARLEPAKPEGGIVPVRLNEAADWSGYAEYRLRSKLAQAEKAELAVRCPSVAADETVAPSTYAPGWTPDPTLAGKASIALAPLDGLRAAAEAAAARSADAPDDSGLRERSDAAVKAFWRAYAQAMALHSDAGLRFPEIAVIQPPPACRPLQTEPGRDVPEAQWLGQQGVIVRDPRMDLGVPQVGVRLSFRDGSHREGQTDGRGFFAPVPQIKADVKSVTISYDVMALKPVTLPVNRAGRVLVVLDFDYRTAQPAFDAMILTRTAEGLTPEGYGKGVYVKGKAAPPRDSQGVVP